MIRKIHLDFHTRSEVVGVGTAFDPQQFAATLADAHVNALATPGKCQYGLTYFNTRLGQPHPGLARPDLFAETIRACVARGIRVQAYFTLGLDDVIAHRHPDWRQRYRDGTCAQWGARHICFASPYVEQVVVPEALEMLERCPGLCGFWFDICLYCDGAFHSPHFDRVAREQLDGQADDQGQRWHLARRLVRQACQRIDAAIQAKLPGAENYFNSLVVPGEARNIPLQPLQEVENPIFFGGPELLTAQARWLRGHGARTIGLVSRFQGPWMDPGTLRTADQMLFDVARVVSLGCDVSMGDHRHPNGTLDPEVYRRLTPIYAELGQLEQWLDGATACREAVLVSPVLTGSPHLMPTLPPTALHAARLLEEIGVQFDVATDDQALPPSELVIALGCEPNLSLSTQAGVLHLPSSQGSGTAHSAAGHVANAGATFLRAAPELGIGSFAHAITLPTIALPEGGQILAHQLGSASQSPPCCSGQIIGPAIVQHGHVIRSAVALIDEQVSYGNAYPTALLKALIERLLPRRRVRHSAGSSVAAHLHRIPAGYALHLVHWAIDRWGKQAQPVSRFPTLGPIAVELWIPEHVSRVSLQPTDRTLAFTSQNEICRFELPNMRVWQVVALELIK